MQIYKVDSEGYYGEFGGAFVPEVLYPNVEELRSRYLGIIEDPKFQKDLMALLHNFAGRPTPLYKAERLSKQAGGRVYLKREDLCHTGAHKINNTIGQALLARMLGKRKIVAETGAGQHGVATAAICARMGLECTVFMGAIDMERQHLNVERMKLMGAQVVPVVSGAKTLKDATNEAMRHWIRNPFDTHYIIGSVVGPHPYPDLVARFQSIISAEMLQQLTKAEGHPDPDWIVACVGGGSNAAGAFYHYLDKPGVKLVGAEAAGKGVHSGFSAATIALGRKGILHGSRTMIMQTSDGQVIEPHSISAGLDYPGIGPLHAYLNHTGRVRFVAVEDDEALEAGVELSKLEGIIPATESAHALAALKTLGHQDDDVVVICLSGRGDKDLETYMKFGNY